MREDGFLCKRCGHCCTELSGGYCFTTDISEVAVWADVAPHLLDWLAPLPFGSEPEYFDGWISPVTGEEVKRCPWLRVYKHQKYKNKGLHCLIQDYKPCVCDDYPHHILHALNTGCPGFDHLSEEAKHVEARKALISELYELLTAKRVAEKYGPNPPLWLFT